MDTKMDNDYQLGLPAVVVTLLEEKYVCEGSKMKYKIVCDGDYTQLTITWLPTQGKYRKDHFEKPKGYRKKTPSELKRDTQRQKDYLKKKSGLSEKCKENQDNSYCKPKNGHMIQEELSSQIGVQTRAMNRKLDEKEKPRNASCGMDLSCDFISPEKCAEQSDFDISNVSDIGDLFDTPVNMVHQVTNTDPNSIQSGALSSRLTDINNQNNHEENQFGSDSLSCSDSDSVQSEIADKETISRNDEINSSDLYKSLQQVAYELRNVTQMTSRLGSFCKDNKMNDT